MALTNGTKVKISWHKGLSRKTLETLRNIKPSKLECFILDKKYTYFVFEKDLTRYEGTAICSILDPFDQVTGKNKAAGRAIQAYKNGFPSGIVRKDFSRFPVRWTIRQALNVKNCPVDHKSKMTSKEIEA